MAKGFLTWARDRIADLFAVDEPPSATVPVQPAPVGNASAAAAHPEPESPLLAKLRRVSAAAGGKVMAGKVHFVNLEEVQARLGPLWERKRQYVTDLAASIVAAALTSKDLFTRVDDTTFILIFATLSKEEAQVKCALIAEQVMKRIFGDEASLATLQVQSVVAEVDGKLVFESVNPVDVLDRLMDRAQEAEEVPAPPARPSSRDLAGLFNNDEPDVVPADLQFFFRPMWSVRRSAMTTYLCYPTTETDGRGVHSDYHALPHGEASSLVGELDLMTLHTIAVRMAELQRQGKQTLLAGTVHAKTLESRETRNEFIAMCQAIPEKLRRLLIYEIAGVPVATAPETRIAQLVSTVRPFVQAVVLRCPLESRRLAGLRMLGVGTVSIHLGPSAPSEERLLADMNRFAELAAKGQLRSVAHGLTSRSLATIAIGAGFTYIDGEAVDPPRPEPGQMRKFDLVDFYR